MIASRWILPACLLMAASAAFGQGRIPQDAARGTMSPATGMSVLLDGNTVTLAAGAIIRNQNNLIIVPSALPSSSEVRYSLDAQGRISRVWVLTDEEKRQHSKSSRGTSIPVIR
jgi:hypothetical protein